MAKTRLPVSPVGKGGANHVEDVRLVQSLLNAWLRPRADSPDGLEGQAVSLGGGERFILGWAPPPPVEARLSIFRAIREGRLAKVTDHVERALGRKPIAFNQWAQENAAAFL